MSMRIGAVARLVKKQDSEIMWQTLVWARRNPEAGRPGSETATGTAGLEKCR
jgi:hypothetical protein